jgi:mannose-6-phosphate isomerase-like protein (cupin superfamily)
MNQIVAVDVTRFALDLHRDLSVTPRATKPGPPERIDGVTIGFVSVTRDVPHNGEVHPDGDEILYVISGRLRVTGESDPHDALDMGPGDACIVRKGEWHRVLMVEPAQLIHITLGHEATTGHCEDVFSVTRLGLTVSGRARSGRRWSAARKVPNNGHSRPTQDRSDRPGRLQCRDSQSLPRNSKATFRKESRCFSSKHGR